MRRAAPPESFGEHGKARLVRASRSPGISLGPGFLRTFETRARAQEIDDTALEHYLFIHFFSFSSNSLSLPSLSPISPYFPSLSPSPLSFAVLTKSSMKPGPNCVVLLSTKSAYPRRNSAIGATSSPDHEGALTSQMVSMSK